MFLLLFFFKHLHTRVFSPSVYKKKTKKEMVCWRLNSRRRRERNGGRTRGRGRDQVREWRLRWYFRFVGGEKKETSDIFLGTKKKQWQLVTTRGEREMSCFFPLHNSNRQPGNHTAKCKYACFLFPKMPSPMLLFILFYFILPPSVEIVLSLWTIWLGDLYNSVSKSKFYYFYSFFL